MVPDRRLASLPPCQRPPPSTRDGEQVEERGCEGLGGEGGRPSARTTRREPRTRSRRTERDATRDQSFGFYRRRRVLVETASTGHHPCARKTGPAGAREAAAGQGRGAVFGPVARLPRHCANAIAGGRSRTCALFYFFGRVLESIASVWSRPLEKTIGGNAQEAPAALRGRTIRRPVIPWKALRAQSSRPRIAATTQPRRRDQEVSMRNCCEGAQEGGVEGAKARSERRAAGGMRGGEELPKGFFCCARGLGATGVAEGGSAKFRRARPTPLPHGKFDEGDAETSGARSGRCNWARGEKGQSSRSESSMHWSGRRPSKHSRFVELEVQMGRPA